VTAPRREPAAWTTTCKGCFSVVVATVAKAEELSRVVHGEQAQPANQGR
jgi:hypothetical protein